MLEELKIAVITGILQGAVYGLLAVGLVLVYKGMKVFNFAQGEFGTVAAYITWALYTKADNEHLAVTGGHWFPYWAAVPIALVCVVALGLIMERLVIRPLLDASRVTLLVATIGVALLFISIEIFFGQALPRTLQPIVAENATHPTLILGVGVTTQQLLIMGALFAVAIGLILFFRTDRGLAVLGLSQDQTATRVVGISVPGMSRIIWMSAAFFGAVAGILYAPVLGFAPAFMTVGSSAALVPAFTGAVLGGMDSLVGAFVGAVVVGLAYNLGIVLLGQHAGVPGAQDLTMFALLLIVLLARPQGLFGKETA
jgi:branched-chain amino acid transport system permease protein